MAWSGAQNLLATARAAHVKQPDGNSKDYGLCALMSTVGILVRVRSPDNLLSKLNRRWVAAVALNTDMGPIARLPSLGELHAAVLDALPAPRTPLTVADIPHQVGLPEARTQHALLCMAAAEGGMSMVLTVFLRHAKDAMQQQRRYAPQPWEENARRWLHVENVPPTHAMGEADMGKLVVLEGAEYWVCVRVDKGGWNGLWLARASSGGSSPGARLAVGFSGNLFCSLAPCVRRTGARPGTSRRRRPCSWR